MDKILIGIVAKPQGLKGEIKINPITDDINRFKKLTYVYIDSKKFDIEYVSVRGQFVVIKVKGINSCESVGNFAEQAKKEKILDNNERRNIEPPEDEVHFNSEPDSAKHTDKNGVDNKLRTGIFVVPKNVIDIMPEKSGNRHIKAVKEIGNGRALERKIKVLRKLNSKTSSKASCHIAKTGKIEKDHHGKNNHIKPCADYGNFLGI